MGALGSRYEPARRAQELRSFTERIHPIRLSNGLG
jgi:hypothetical protein